jgi:outer membrane protein insertion porin family
VQRVALRNPDGSFVPANPAFPVQGANGQCVSNCWNIPIPYQQLVTPGGDLALTGNLEYRITIAGPVAIAPFVDVGTDPILRVSQLQINQSQYDSLLSTYFGCPVLTPAFGCDINYAVQGKTLGISQLLRPVPGTNWVPRMSTGLELQMMLPVVNAPFRIYYAYNALRLNSSASPPIKLTPSMFPDSGAGIYTYEQAFDSLSSSYTLREPRKTFRFTVATTF